MKKKEINPLFLNKHYKLGFRYFLYKIFHLCPNFKNAEKELKTKHGTTNIPVSENVYCSGPTYKDFIKEQKIIHNIFKHFILLPGLFLCKLILGKRLLKEIPDKPWLTNFKIFDKVFTTSLEEWSHFLIYAKHQKDITTKKDKLTYIQRFKKTISHQSLTLMKRIFLTICIKDTAYMELFNILSYNYTKSLADYYKSDKFHLLYTCPNVSDARYFLLSSDLNSLNIREVNLRDIQDTPSED